MTTIQFLTARDRMLRLCQSLTAVCNSGIVSEDSEDILLDFVEKSTEALNRKNEFTDSKFVQYVTSRTRLQKIVRAMESACNDVTISKLDEFNLSTFVVVASKFLKHDAEVRNHVQSVQVS